MTTADWAQVASALFTALAAGAAFASVFRVERDRWRRTIPEFHIEVLADVPNDEMRMTVVNLAAPAREVRVMGTIGPFGFVHSTPPSTYWRSGESRTYRISMPLMTDAMVYAFVEGRDLGKRQLAVATVGGATYRSPLRRAKKLSAAKEWQRLFPGQAGPLDVQYTPMAIELVERNL
jgi:hypothetical protein